MLPEQQRTFSEEKMQENLLTFARRCYRNGDQLQDKTLGNIFHASARVTLISGYMNHLCFYHHVQSSIHRSRSWPKWKAGKGEPKEAMLGSESLPFGSMIKPGPGPGPKDTPT